MRLIHVRRHMFPILTLSFVLACTSGLHAQDAAEIEATMKKFLGSDAGAAEVMDAVPAKFDSKGQRIKQAQSHLLQAKKVKKKNEARSKIFKLSSDGVRIAAGELQGRAGIDNNVDDVADFVDNRNSIVRSLQVMDRMNLKSVRLNQNPWSGDYWPLYMGTTAKRYADYQFPGGEDFLKNRTYVLNNPQVAVEKLSPAEKYDLLVNDASKTFTRLELEQGQTYVNRMKIDEWSWMGICHGWAPAAYKVDRPTRTVNVIAADGKTVIPFYPDDLKALASSLWASANVPSRIIGGRCDVNIKKLEKTRSGRILDQECFDNNPGAWHLSVVNQMGISQQSFVIDATFDDQVWNHPTVSYSYSYFNPQTGKAVDSIEAATVALKDFSNDRFKRNQWSPIGGRRSKDIIEPASTAVAVIGIAMDLTYVIETNPVARHTDSPSNDATKTVRYMYDLELNALGEIVGGEWYTNLHPDFLWTPARDQAETPADSPAFAAIAWSPERQALPEEFALAGRRASRSNMPLAEIVYRLIKASRNE